QRGLWGHPPPQLSGAARQRPGVGPRLSCGSGRAADRAHDPATPGAHPCRRAVATLAVWRRVRRLLRPDSTAASRALLAIRARALAYPRRIVAVWRNMPNHPGLHEGVPRAPRGYALQADPLPVFALRGRTVFSTDNPWHKRR